jgi:DNA polymerase-1
MYQCIETLPEARELGRLLLEKEEVCFDTETTSLDILSAELIGMSFSFEAGKAYYVPVPQERDQAQEWIAAFQPFFKSESVRKIGQNLKYDIGVLLNYGIEVRGPLFDTMIAHYLLQPDMRHKMDILAETYLNYTTISYESVVGKKGKMQKTLREVPVEAVVDYAAEDADITLQLKAVFEPKLKETGVLKVFENIEMPLVPVLARMEREGIRVDVASLNSYSHELGQLIDELEGTIVALAGRPFNVDPRVNWVKYCSKI